MSSLHYKNIAQIKVCFSADLYRIWISSWLERMHFLSKSSGTIFVRIARPMHPFVSKVVEASTSLPPLPALIAPAREAPIPGCAGLAVGAPAADLQQHVGARLKNKQQLWQQQLSRKVVNLHSRNLGVGDMADRQAGTNYRGGYATRKTNSVQFDCIFVVSSIHFKKSNSQGSFHKPN